MSTALIDEITAALHNMKETGKADQSITNRLEALANMFKESQERWLTSRNTRVSIYFYYAARNAALVVSRMKERFLSLNEVDGNTSVAEQSLPIIVSVKDLLELTRNEKPDEATAKLIIERVKELRRLATDTRLVQAQEKELEDIDKLLNYLSKLRK